MGCLALIMHDALGSATPAVSDAAVWRLLGGLHPLVIHFTIALILVAAAIECMLALRRGHRVSSAGLTCLALGAASAAVAAWLGWLAGIGIGTAALASLLDPSVLAAAPVDRTITGGIPQLPRFAEARQPGTYAANCLLARRLAERDVRFIQLYHRGWDQHENLPSDLPLQCRDTDQPSAALVLDLKQRGLLDDTLVVWGGEFGRTVYCQGRLTETNYGRDHHPRCFSIWMAGGGVNPGTTYGVTDDCCYNIVRDPVHVHDLQATLLHCLGVDHERLTFRHQGRDFRLTDVHGRVVDALLA